MNHSSQSDLFWQAFLYASGELPPLEASAFENALAESQSARQALADAVALGAALARAPASAWQFAPRVAQYSPPPFWRRAGVAAASVAACLAAICAIQLSPSISQFPVLGSPEAESAAAAELALAWSHGLASDADDSSSNPSSPPPDAGMAANLDPDSPAANNPELANDATVPSWLLAALSDSAFSPREAEPVPSPSELEPSAIHRIP